MKKILLIFILSIFNSFGQSLDEMDLTLIKNNILSYRIKYLAEIYKSQRYGMNHECLLPQYGWDLRLDYSLVKEGYKNFKGYAVFEIDNPNYSYIKFIDNVNFIIDSSGCGFVENSDRIIVGKKDKEIIFISGMIFKSHIASFFDLSIKNPETFYNFISIKFVNYNFQNIRYKKQTRKKIFFECNTTYSNKKILIKIDKIDFDLIEITFPKINKMVSIK